MTLRRSVLALSVAGVGLLASCEAVCGCSYPPPSEVVYGRVESAAGTGVPTAVMLYRLALDTACVFDDPAVQHGEIDVGMQGRFRGEVASFGQPITCLELRAFDPAVGKADTVSILILVDFANPDSTGVVLRLP